MPRGHLILSSFVQELPVWLYVVRTLRNNHNGWVGGRQLRQHVCKSSGFHAPMQLLNVLVIGAAFLMISFLMMQGAVVA
eukprot:3978020-Pyramimonas_sp.AAC.2